MGLIARGYGGHVSFNIWGICEPLFILQFLDVGKNSLITWYFKYSCRPILYAIYP